MSQDEEAMPRMLGKVPAGEFWMKLRMWLAFFLSFLFCFPEWEARKTSKLEKQYVFL